MRRGNSYFRGFLNGMETIVKAMQLEMKIADKEQEERDRQFSMSENGRR